MKLIPILGQDHGCMLICMLIQSCHSLTGQAIAPAGMTIGCGMWASRLPTRRDTPHQIGYFMVVALLERLQTLPGHNVMVLGQNYLRWNASNTLGGAAKSAFFARCSLER